MNELNLKRIATQALTDQVCAEVAENYQSIPVVVDVFRDSLDLNQPDSRLLLKLVMLGACQVSECVAFKFEMGETL